MSVRRNELLHAVAMVSESRNLRASVKTSLIASALVAGATAISGILLGPRGLAIGATVGGLFAYHQTRGTFKSVFEIINDELSEEQKELLYQYIFNAFKEVRIEDVARMIILISSPGDLQNLAIETTISFLSNELNMQVES